MNSNIRLIASCGPLEVFIYTVINHLWLPGRNFFCTIKCFSISFCISKLCVRIHWIWAIDFNNRLYTNKCVYKYGIKCVWLTGFNYLAVYHQQHHRVHSCNTLYTQYAQRMHTVVNTDFTYRSLSVSNKRFELLVELGSMEIQFNSIYCLSLHKMR